MTETDLAWIAGFIDADGSIMIRRSMGKAAKNPTYYPVIKVTQTASRRWLLEFLKESFGGYIAVNSAKDNVVYWQVQSRKAIDALKLLQPYIKGKQHELQLALESDQYIQNRWTGKWRQPNPNLEKLEALKQALIDYRKEVYRRA